MCELAIGALVLLAAQAVDHSEAAPQTDARVDAWVATVESDTSSETDRQRALGELRAAAGGPPSDAGTRDAVFALARLLPGDGPAGERELMNVLRTAVGLYPDDPRTIRVLRQLGRLQLETGDNYGAHYSLSRLFREADTEIDPELRLAAAGNAIEVADPLSALDWSQQVDPEGVSDELRIVLWRVRLTAAQAVGREAEALRASESLEQLAPDALRLDARALLAAARIDAAVGRVESSVERYDAFVNIHTRAAERPAALLERGKLLARLHRRAEAGRSFDWVVDDYPKAPEADLARVERVGLVPEQSVAERARGYQEAAVLSRTEQGADVACGRILEELLSDGQPLEAISTLSWMARNTDGFAALAARRHLMRGLEPSMKLLASRDDDIGLAAAAAAADVLALAQPAGMRDRIDAVRQRLGLRRPHLVVEQAQTYARSGRWDDLDRTLAMLRPSVRLDRAGRAAVARLKAEALWRETRGDEALLGINEALGSLEPGVPGRRALLVLRGDILFASGKLEQACVDYGVAREAGETSWLASQWERCEQPQPSSVPQ